MSYPSEWYENTMVPALFGPWSSYLIQSASAQPGERVLDVACGTGIVARNIARCVGSQGMVIGLDLNPGRLGLARTVAGRGGLAREELAIEWCMGRAERLPLPDVSFDLLLCQFGLMLFSDRHAALTEMHRILRTGGRVVLSVWQGLDRHPFYQTLHDASVRRLGRSAVQDVFSLGDSGELHSLLTDAGFQRVGIEPVSITARFPNPEEFLAWELDVDPTEMPNLQYLNAQAQQAILAALHQDMQTPLHETMQGDQVVIVFHAHIAHASR